MASIFDFMQRMIEGKPAFGDDQAKSDGQIPQPSAPPEAATENTIRKGDEHSFPLVYVKPRITTHIHGNDIEVYGHIINTWHGEVMLDKITLVNVPRGLNVSLTAGEEHEVLLYKGPKLQHEYHEAWLDYKTWQERDYFRAVHDVSFTYHAEDTTYVIDEMHLHPPIRDIYE